MLTMNKLNENKLISTIYVVGVLCFLLSSGHAFAQKNKESNSSINIDRIRFMTSNNSLAEEAPNIYVSNYDLVSGYEKVNRAHRSLTYVSGWLFDLGLGLSESRIKESFTYETGMIEIQVEQDIEIQFYDLSLVFGETFTIQPGLSYADGKSSSQFYGVQKEQHSNSNTATYEVEFSGEGYAYFVNFGVDLWGIELIAGYRKEFLKFPKIDNTGSEIDSEEVFKITSYNNIGIGYSF